MVLHEKLKQYDLILASQSPRRKMLMDGLDLKFEVVVRDNIDESVPGGMSKLDIPEYLAKFKSDAYVDLLRKNTIIITADTIVWINDHQLGKPKSYDDAESILNELSGNVHEVITGVCLRSKNQLVSFKVISRVCFRKLSKEEIKYYLNTYKPFDKAGAYGIQEWIGYTGIEKIDGSFYNVMGLPVQTLYIELNKFINNEKG